MTEELTKDSVKHQFCSDWLKGEIIKLFERNEELEAKLVAANGKTQFCPICEAAARTKNSDKPSENVTKDDASRIAELEAALGVARKTLAEIGGRCDCSLGARCGHGPDLAMMACRAFRLTSQPAVAQAAEKWKRMEAGIENTRKILKSAECECGFETDRESSDDAVCYRCEALTALDACEVKEEKTNA